MLYLSLSGGLWQYPSCQQITVSGGGSVEPEEESLVSFPGAYQEDDPR